MSSWSSVFCPFYMNTLSPVVVEQTDPFFFVQHCTLDIQKVVHSSIIITVRKETSELLLHLGEEVN